MKKDPVSSAVPVTRGGGGEAGRNNDRVETNVKKEGQTSSRWPAGRCQPATHEFRAEYKGPPLTRTLTQK